MTTENSRADALTEAVARTIETIKRQLDLITECAPGDFLDKRPIVQSLDAHVRRLERALAASPVEQPAPPTAQDALAAIETFEIVGENNDSREPNNDDRFILTEFIAHAFGGFTVEQPAAAPIEEGAWLDVPKKVYERTKSDPALTRVVYTAPQPPAQADDRPLDDELWDQTLRERDEYHEMADKLAAAIAAHFGVDIGEHSNANCPWDEALEVIENTEKADAREVLADGLIRRCRELLDLSAKGESSQEALCALADTYHPDISAHDRRSMAVSQTHIEAMRALLQGANHAE
ncbi:hypothetical protein ACJ51O_07885 [Burkholderia pyrrocinia]|uniref:hypothetical protein n=1 Tax=Burkholderia pyrrocinia TaxID=60550 RepID=UPI0038B4577F